MKYDPFKWKEVPRGKEIDVPSGQVQLRLSRPGAVFTRAEGVEGLLGYGTAFDVQTASEMTLWLDDFNPEDPMSTRMFIYWPEVLPVEDLKSVVFTNIDRTAEESPHLNFVKGGLRALEFAKRDMLREVRQAAAQMLNPTMQRTADADLARKAKDEVDDDPEVIDDDPQGDDPAPAPAPVPKAKK